METKKKQTILALAGARAIPPLMIVLYHYSEGHHYTGLQWLDRITTRGYLWVEFFFVLSGFILTHAYATRLPDLLRPRGYLDFLRARLIRLYPLHLFMLLLVLAMVIVLRALSAAGGYVSIFDLPWHQDVSPRGFVLSLFLVQAWNTMDRLTWNGLSWFVSAEFALVLLFPALLWLAAPQKGQPWRGLALVAAGLGGLVLLLAGSRHGLDITFRNGVLRGLCDFTVGMGLAVIFRQVQHQRIPVWTHSVIQALLLLLLAYSVTRTGWSHTFNDIYTVLPIMGLVFALAFDKGFLAEALKTRPFQTVGEWSYAIYIGQTAWLLTLRFLKQRVFPAPDTLVLGWRWADIAWWLEPAGLLIACLLWGAFLARHVEIPAAAKLRARFGRRLDPKSIPTPS